MKRIIAITIILFVSAATVATAQDKDKNHEDRWEKFRAEKVSFLTSRLELTPSEAQKFWPVYNQLEKERWEAQKHRRELEEQVRDAEQSMSEQKITQLTRDFAGSLQKEANLLVEYNEKFLEILSPGKVLMLYKAENEFRMHMIKKYRDRRKNGN